MRRATLNNVSFGGAVAAANSGLAGGAAAVAASRRASAPGISGSAFSQLMDADKADLAIEKRNAAKKELERRRSLRSENLEKLQGPHPPAGFGMQNIPVSSRASSSDVRAGRRRPPPLGKPPLPPREQKLSSPNVVTTPPGGKAVGSTFQPRISLKDSVATILPDDLQASRTRVATSGYAGRPPLPGNAGHMRFGKGRSRDPTPDTDRTSGTPAGRLEFVNTAAQMEHLFRAKSPQSRVSEQIRNLARTDFEEARHAAMTTAGGSPVSRALGRFASPQLRTRSRSPLAGNKGSDTGFSDTAEGEPLSFGSSGEGPSTAPGTWRSGSGSGSGGATTTSSSSRHVFGEDLARSPYAGGRSSSSHLRDGGHAHARGAGFASTTSGVDSSTAAEIGDRELLHDLVGGKTLRRERGRNSVFSPGSRGRQGQAEGVIHVPIPDDGGTRLDDRFASGSEDSGLSGSEGEPQRQPLSDVGTLTSREDSGDDAVRSAGESGSSGIVDGADLHLDDSPLRTSANRGRSPRGPAIVGINGEANPRSVRRYGSRSYSPDDHPHAKQLDALVDITSSKRLAPGSKREDSPARGASLEDDTPTRGRSSTRERSRGSKREDSPVRGASLEDNARAENSFSEASSSQPDSEDFGSDEDQNGFEEAPKLVSDRAAARKAKPAVYKKTQSHATTYGPNSIMVPESQNADSRFKRSMAKIAARKEQFWNSDGGVGGTGTTSGGGGAGALETQLRSGPPSSDRSAVRPAPGFHVGAAGSPLSGPIGAMTGGGGLHNQSASRSRSRSTSKPRGRPEQRARSRSTSRPRNRLGSPSLGVLGLTPDQEIQRFVNAFPDFRYTIQKTQKKTTNPPREAAYTFAPHRTKEVFTVAGKNYVKVGGGLEPLTTYLRGLHFAPVYIGGGGSD